MSSVFPSAVPEIPVTAYGILRVAGLEIGKQDYMLHLAPFVKQRHER